MPPGKFEPAHPASEDHRQRGHWDKGISHMQQNDIRPTKLVTCFLGTAFKKHYCRKDGRRDRRDGKTRKRT
jgi:hypothetical protein